MRFGHFLSVALIAGAAHPAIAQRPGGDITVTASRSGDPTPLGVAILPDTRLLGGESLGDALSRTADAYVQMPGGRSGFGAIFLRGADPNFTGVFLDGIALNNATSTRGGAVNVSEISASAFERIEIAAAPSSSLYGSGTLAGVVNLIVPGGLDRQVGCASIDLGSQGLRSGQLQWRGPLGADAGASVTVNLDDDGTPTPLSMFRAFAVTAKVADRSQNDPNRLILRYSSIESAGYPDTSGGPDLATMRTTDRRQSRELIVGARHRIFSNDSFALDASASILTRQDDSETPGVAPSAFNFMGVPSGHNETRYRRIAGQLNGTSDVAGWRLVAGLEAQHERGRSEGQLVFFGYPLPAGFKADRATYSLYAEGNRAAGQWLVNLATRVDRIDGMGANLSARVAAERKLGETGLSLRTSVATAYKSPSFYALANPLVGNPELDAETSQGGEAGLVARGVWGEAALSAVHTRFKGLIDFFPGPPPRLENRARVLSKGVSAVLVLKPVAALDLAGHVQFVNVSDSETGETLLNRPRWRGGLRLDWAANEKMSLVLRLDAVGSRSDYAVPTGPAKLPAYVELGLAGSWRLGEGVTARLGIDNLSDADHRIQIGFPAPGRRVRIGVAKSF